MKTNETVKKQLLIQAEETIEKLLTEMEEVKTGDLQRLEQCLLENIMELGRRSMETILVSETREEAVAVPQEGRCGHALKRAGEREKTVLTLMGAIVIKRAYYHCKEERPAEGVSQRRCPGTIPFDEQWGLTRHQASPGVQRMIAKLAARLTFEEAADAIADLLPVSLSARQVGLLLRPIGAAFAQQENEQASQYLYQGSEKRRSEQERQEEQGELIRRLYVEVDGVMARFRRGSVPMERQEEERAGDVYREIKVGAAFLGLPGRERSELVPGVVVDACGPKAYVARQVTVEEFAPLVYALARQMGLLRAQQVVILGDGARWIWKLADEQFPGAVQIVDEYHAREHVWKVARAAFAAEPELRDAWATRVTELLGNGQIHEVIAAIERLPALSPEPGKTKSVQDIEAEYFRHNAHRMQYPVFRAQGIHLGSGVAEAACKTVVSTRAKKSGMRWLPHGLATVLAVRSALLSNLFDRRWQAYSQRVS